MRRTLRRGCADMSDGFLLLFVVFLIVGLFAFCHAAWYSSDEQKARRKAINDYEIRYHHQEGRWN